MEGYIDIHSHILPGIDDGAKDFEMSMEMLKIAYDNKIRKIILTPHNKLGRHNARPEKIRELVERIEMTARAADMDITFYAGNELYYSSEAVHSLEEGLACTMADSSYVLVEFGPMDSLEHIRGGIYQILSAGYRPIIAHAERYESVCAKVGNVEDLSAMGCYIQVNAGSVMGQYGMGIRQFLKKVMKRELVHFIATDCHDKSRRSPKLLECARYMEKKFGKEYTHRLLCENPICVIENRYI
ncbi:hypothetical protein D3Z45_17480 [Lachnospiraceae bacterium]|nr:hypothetical protein [Lachnospiraceae bacterium]